MNSTFGTIGKAMTDKLTEIVHDKNSTTCGHAEARLRNLDTFFGFRKVFSPHCE